jgi:NAD(P)-dependent dehydrogenase (short-subunit alcohol dehydrogenase family)
LGEEHYSVAVCGRNEERLRNQLKEFADSNLDIAGIQADVSSSSDMEKLVSFTVNRFGGIDCIVCNAGIAAFGTVETLDEKVWDQGIKTKLTSIYYAAKRVIPEMRKRGGGSIVTISSVHAFATEPNRDLIVLTNAGIVGLTRSLAVNYGKEGIRANVVCPSPIDTPEWRKNWKSFYPDIAIENTMAAVGKKHPLGRIGSVEEVAEVVAFLCSERARFVTGVELKVDGGLLSQIRMVPDNIETDD